MRRVTQLAVLMILAAVVVLLALGALPSLLKTGDPYYMTAEAANGSVLPANATAVDATGLSERRFPYATGALEKGRSDPYWRGPVGIKEAFAHSPFDELAALRDRSPDAAVDGGVVVADNGTLYRLAVRQRP